MQETLDNKKKKKKKISKEKIQKRNKIITLIVCIVSAIALIGLTIFIISHNMYQTGQIGDYDNNYIVKYNNFMKQDENVYYVYFYLNEDTNCKNTKSTILSYQRSIAQKKNAPIYTYEVTKDLANFINMNDNYISIANLQGITKNNYQEAKLGDVPCLALIRKQDGIQTIMSYVIGLESIDAQLKLNVNYEYLIG